ncbi:MAG: inorganic phosphate transporter [Chloroflexi bacterium]|nr:MAG: inorganic phosphate transporter [Chloroflexota bacterium]
MTWLIVAVVVLALLFDFLNGIHDSSNIVATMISSRSLSPRVALGITALAEFCGPFIFGVAVAETIGHEIVRPESISLQVILASLVGAIFWNLLTWYLGIPSSSSHALIGGFIGAVFVGAGWQAIQMDGLMKVFIALFTSPIIGLIVGYIITKIIFLMCWNAKPSINAVFRRGQVVTAVALALSHGANDAQKTMGIITMALVTGGFLATFEVPVWVIFACATMIAFGTSMGGWKLIRTLGAKFYKIRPIHGFGSQLASSFVILGNSLVGGPVSTTQVVSSAIMGVGAAERVNKVRWGVATEIGTAWLLTIPATAVMAAGIYWILIRIVP